MIWLTMRKTGKLELSGIVLCSFAYKADDGQYFLTSLCQEKQQEQATHPEASLYLNTHLDSALGLRAPQQRLEPSWNPKQRRCSCNESLKATTRSNTVFLFLGLGPHCQASRTSCDGKSRMTFHTYLHRPMITQPSPWYSEIRLWGPSPGYGVTWSLLWPLVSGLIPHPQEKKDPCNTYEAFVLPVSLQLRIIVSFRSQVPVIYHPLSPKGGYVSAQVVCLGGGGELLYR